MFPDKYVNDFTIIEYLVDFFKRDHKYILDRDDPEIRDRVLRINRIFLLDNAVGTPPFFRSLCESKDLHYEEVVDHVKRSILRTQRYLLVVKIDTGRHWYLICPTCAWFAGFGTYYYNGRDKPRPHRRSDICSTCGTLLLWEGVSSSINNFLLELKFKDPNTSTRCGNSWCGFTSKLALTIIRDENDIDWWLNGTSKVS